MLEDYCTIKITNGSDVSEINVESHERAMNIINGAIGTVAYDTISLINYYNEEIFSTTNPNFVEAEKTPKDGDA